MKRKDALDGAGIAVKAHELELAVGGPVLQLSGVAHLGLTEVLRAVAAEVEKRDADEQAELDEANDGGGGWRP